MRKTCGILLFVGMLCYFWRSFGGLVVVGGCIRCFQRLPPMTEKAVFSEQQKFYFSIFPCIAMIFRFGVPCLFRFAASLSPGSGRRRYTVQPGSILDRMQPEGGSGKTGGCLVDGCRDILTHFQIQPADLCCDERGVGWRKRGGAVFWFSMQKIIKSVRRTFAAKQVESG